MAPASATSSSWSFGVLGAVAQAGQQPTLALTESLWTDGKARLRGRPLWELVFAALWLGRFGLGSRPGMGTQEAPYRVRIDEGFAICADDAAG